MYDALFSKVNVKLYLAIVVGGCPGGLCDSGLLPIRWKTEILFLHFHPYKYVYVEQKSSNKEFFILAGKVRSQCN